MSHVTLKRHLVVVSLTANFPEQQSNAFDEIGSKFCWQEGLNGRVVDVGGCIYGTSAALRRQTGGRCINL